MVLPQNILVTGGAGFIGSHVVDGLLAAGCQVRVLDNLSTGFRHNLQLENENIDFMHGDIRDPHTVARAVNGVDAVIHLAAHVSVTASFDDPVSSADINIHGFATLLDALQNRAFAGRLIYASSAAVYGALGQADTPLSEELPLPAPLSPYGMEKQTNEHQARLFAPRIGFKPLGIRMFNVYGSRQDPSSPYSGVISIFRGRLAESKPLTIFGDGQQTRDFIYIGDVVKVIMGALTTETTGVMNIATGNPSSLLDLVAALGCVLDVSPVVNFAEERPGDIKHSLADVTRMQTELGITKTHSLEAGLRNWLTQAAAAEQAV